MDNSTGAGMNIEELKKLGIPTNSYILAMRYFSGNKKFDDLNHINTQLELFNLPPAAELVEGQYALLQTVVNLVRPIVESDYSVKPVVYTKKGNMMTDTTETQVSEINDNKPTTKTVKVNSEPKKNRKRERYDILVSELEKAGAANVYVSKEALAELVGTTAGSISVMLCVLRKDEKYDIDCNRKVGYRIIPSANSRVA